MVIDTSALIAIERAEPERQSLLAAIVSTDVRLVSAATYVECVAVMARRLPLISATATVDRTFKELGLAVIEVTAEQARVAGEALEAYGRARHPAGLNYGDSFAYALAKATGEPLLFKGDDFSRTDVAVAAY